MLLLTDAGRFDVLREVQPIGEFGSVAAESEGHEIDGLPVRVLSIDGLIRTKSFAGRAKDKQGVIYLQALKRKISAPPTPPSPPPP